MLHRIPSTAPAFEPAHPERTRHPGETVAALVPHLAGYGITRLARQTGLDRIGIPCFTAVRPNARTLSVNTGKGLDDWAARASALMEAIEYAVAEAPEVPLQRTTDEGLRRAGHAPFDISRWLPPGFALPPGRELDWIEGRDLLTGALTHAPRDALAIGSADDLPEVSQSTNGLAAGNTLEEAVVHALCELVERDASTLWVFRSDAEVASTALDPLSFADPGIERLLARIAAAGLRLRLFDQTSDLGIPVILALLSPATEPPARFFELAAGCSCHPLPARAAIRAITEAAQSRMSNIAGARDDVDPAEYSQGLSPALLGLVALEASGRPPPAALCAPAPLAELHRALLARLAASGVGPVAAFPLGGARAGVSVVRLLAPGLEDQATNRHWRPGPRALRAMLGL